MKKTISILLVIITFSIKAQVIKPKHEKVRIPDLKTKTIYFVLPSGSNDKDFKDVINKYWTFTPFKIITADEVTKNLSVNNVFFTEASTLFTGFNGPGSVSSSFVSF